MLLARLRHWRTKALIGLLLLPPPHAPAQPPPPPSIRYDVEDLGTLSGTWAQAEGIGADGTIVGQAEAIRRKAPTMVGSLTRRRSGGSLSYFDRDSGYTDRQMVDVVALVYILANPRLLRYYYSDRRREDEKRFDIQNDVQQSPPRPVGTPVLLMDGHPHELPTPDDRGGVVFGRAQGIAVGAVRYSPVSDTLHAVAWITEKENVRCVDLEGSRARGDSIAAAIGADGSIVGSVDTGEGITRAFRWADLAPDGKGGFAPRIRQELGTLGGPRSAARAISAAQIVGWSEVAPGQVQAFQWDGTRMQALETPLPLAIGTQTDARAVSGAHYIAGAAYLPDGTRRALLWTDRRGQVLPMLPGTDSADADAVSAQGIVVGAAYHVGMTPPAEGSIPRGRFQPPGIAAPPPSSWAVIWNRGTIQDLNTLIAPTSGWVLRRATGITDHGEIVGWGTLHGQTHAFRLRPRP